MKTLKDFRGRFEEIRAIDKHDDYMIKKIAYKLRQEEAGINLAEMDREFDSVFFL